MWQLNFEVKNCFTLISKVKNCLVENWGEQLWQLYFFNLKNWFSTDLWKTSDWSQFCGENLFQHKFEMKKMCQHDLLVKNWFNSIFFSHYLEKTVQLNFWGEELLQQWIFCEQLFHLNFVVKTILAQFCREKLFRLNFLMINHFDTIYWWITVIGLYLKMK